MNNTNKYNFYLNHSFLNIDFSVTCSKKAVFWFSKLFKLISELLASLKYDFDHGC